MGDEWSASDVDSKSMAGSAGEVESTETKPQRSSSAKAKGKPKSGKSKGDKAAEKTKRQAVPGRHKAGDRKGSKWCRGCHKIQGLSCFALNQVVCFLCKSRLDNIQKQAKRQKQLDWFEEARADPKRLKRMLDRYGSAVEESQKSGLKRPRWSTIQYKESIRTETGTDVFEEGLMMWRSQALGFWRSVDGGEASEEEAKDMWKYFSTNRVQLKIPCDNRGPAKAPLRLRIVVADKVNYRSSYLRCKELEMMEAPLKKGTQEDIDRLTKRAMSNHDKIGSSAADVGIQEAACNMIAAGGGEAFNEANIGLTDITQLAPDISDEENDEEEEEDDDDNEQEQEQGAGGGSAAGAGNGTAKAKAKAKDKEKEQEEQIWFERDRKLNAAYKTLDATYKSVKTEVDDIRGVLQGKLDVIAKLPAAEKSFFSGEVRIAMSRLRGIEVILGPEAKLLEYKNSFQKKAEPSAKSAASSSADPTAALGSAPPTRTYLELVPLATWQAQFAKVLECETPEELEMIKKTCVRYKAPIVELVGVSKKALHDIAKAEKARDTWKAGEKEQKKSGASRPASVQVMNECDGVALPMPKFVEGSGQPLADFNVPCLIQPDMQQRNMFEANADVKVFMHDVFEREFTKPVAGAGKAMERAQKPMPLQIKTMVVRRVDAMLGQPCHDWSSASPALAKAVEPLAVIVSKNHEAITPEKFYLPSVRFCVSGARDIVMGRVSEFSDYCKTKLEEGVSVTSRILKDTLKGMDKVQIEEYVKQGKKLYYASAGAGAAVYCPAAWLFVERYNGTSLWLGFKNHRDGGDLADEVRHCFAPVGPRARRPHLGRLCVDARRRAQLFACAAGSRGGREEGRLRGQP